jgi:hypothetical protein
MEFSNHTNLLVCVSVIAKIKMTHLTAKQTLAHDSWYHQSNDDYLNAPHLPFAYYSCTVPLFDNLNVLVDLRWRPGICLVLWSKKQFSLLPGHSYANADTWHSTLTIWVGRCPTHFLIPSMCQSKRNEDPPWYARSHMAVHMARIVEGGLLARLGVWNLLSKSVPAMVDCHFSQSYCPMYLPIHITRRFRVLQRGLLNNGE